MDVLGWKSESIELDYDENTAHIVITADSAPQPKAYGIEKVMRDNAFNYSFSNAAEETTSQYVEQNDAEVVAIASIGYQSFPDPEDVSELMVSDDGSSVFNVARFYAVAVDPDHQHQGLGFRVMDEVLYWCRKRNVELLWANARESALKFYTNSLNFYAVGERFLDPKTEMTDQRVIKMV